jgi:hypothetical protein
MTVFIILLTAVGVFLFLVSTSELIAPLIIRTKRQRANLHWIARAGVLLLFIAGVLIWFSASPASAQMQMWPGQEIQYCNGIGAISGGGIVCFHDIVDERVEFTFKNSSWHATFWGDGSAPAVLPPLCRISNVHSVTETVFEPGLVRVRMIPCSTGKSGKWTVIRMSR